MNLENIEWAQERQDVTVNLNAFEKRTNISPFSRGMRKHFSSEELCTDTSQCSQGQTF